MRARFGAGAVLFSAALASACTGDDTVQPLEDSGFSPGDSATSNIDATTGQVDASTDATVPVEASDATAPLEASDSIAPPVDASDANVADANDSSFDAADANACTLDSGAPGTLCGGVCTDLTSDPLNCGACSASCEAGAVCSASQCENIAGSLEGLEWYVPCSSGSGTSCSASNPPNVMASLSGATGVTYAVTLNFQGVVEERTYIENPPEDAGPDAGDAGAAPVATGTNASFFITNVETPSLGDSYNIYSLTISDPPLVAYLNDGTSSITNCWLIDYTVTLPMTAGAQITLAANTVDGSEITNHDVNGNPIIVPGYFDGGAFNGQFIAMNVVSVAPIP
jgi:hypothetical protein